MKKILVALFTVTLIFVPISDVVFQDHSSTVDAKRYKSGKKSFNPGNKDNNSLFQNNKRDTENNKQSTVRNNSNTKNKSGPMSGGGLMRGLMFGGLAGLLFGGLLANLGMLGSILGLLINGLAIAALIFIVMKIYSLFQRKKKEQEERNVWKN